MRSPTAFLVLSTLLSTSVIAQEAVFRHGLGFSPIGSSHHQPVVDEEQPAGSALLPVTANIGNSHLLPPAVVLNGFPAGDSTLVRDAYYDGLDEPVGTFQLSASTNASMLFGEGAKGNTCLVRIGSADLGPSIGFRLQVIYADYSSWEQIVPAVVIGDVARYSGPCGNSDDDLLGAAVMVTGMDGIVFSTYEFKVGLDGVYPTLGP